ncbi:MAG: ABC transporter ATP-binding protein [bacterium]
MESLLKVNNLSVEYYRKKQIIPAVENVSLELGKGERIGVAGESGCGKSTLAQTILNLIPKNEGKIKQGEVIFEGKDLLKLRRKDIISIRGREISIIFQDPFSALNPVFKIGNQMGEIFTDIKDKNIIKERCLNLLGKVHLKNPEEILKSYPHQLSGGMRQRVVIAIAIALSPKILIADEPTTALDVTIQKEILDLIDELSNSLKMSLLLVTHNLGVVCERTERIIIMYAGRIVEELRTRELFKQARHPYTKALIQAVPRLTMKDRPDMIKGLPPDPKDYPKGCKFHPRCPFVLSRCVKEEPELKGNDSEKVRCFLYE